MIKRILFLFLVLCTVNNAFGQSLYLKTYGDNQNKPVIFLHGGPGYNSANFEGTTAKSLSENDFYVVIYDRRGEGRSIDSNANYSLDESIKDLNLIIDSLSLDSVVLIGHSFGGMLAIKYTNQFPEFVKSIILVGAPISLQESFNHIIEKSQEIYRKKNDSTNLHYINMLQEMDTTSLMYSSYCFMHAMQNGFYSPDSLSVEADSIYNNFKSNEELYKYSLKMEQKAPQGFWKNDKYTTMNLADDLKKVLKSDIEVYGLYGKEDGLYSVHQINHLKSIIGCNNFKYLANCSHSVFIDQQKKFIEFFNEYLK